MRGKDLSSSIYRVYETVGNGDQAWTSVLDGLFDLTRAHMGSVVHFANGEMKALLRGCGERVQQDYRDYFIRLDPWVQISHDYLVTDGEAVEASHDLVPDPTLHATEFYQDFGRKVGYGYGFGTAVDGGEGAKTVISAIRDQTPLSDEELGWMRSLSPHIRQALRLSRVVEEAQLQRKSLLDCIDQLRRGILLLDRSGRVVGSNRAAERIMSSCDGMVIMAGRLRTQVLREGEQIQALHADLLHGNGEGGTVLVSRPSGRKPWVLTVTSYGEGARRLTCLVITDPEQALEPDSSVIARLYGYTPAETRLARFLVEGETLQTAAELLGITMNTARTHVKRMLSKAGVGSQAGLVGLLSRIPPQAERAGRT